MGKALWVQSGEHLHGARREGLDRRVRPEILALYGGHLDPRADAEGHHRLRWGSFGSPRGDGVSEVRSKEVRGKTTPTDAREPAEASVRREPNAAGASRKRRSRSEPRQGALIFENRIVDCRDRSIRIGVIVGRHRRLDAP